MNPQFLAAMAASASDLAFQVGKATDRQTRKGLLSVLLYLCRGMQDVAPRNASKRAQARADDLGIGDLRQYSFYDAGRFPGGRKGSGMHWEHWKPAVDMRDAILALPVPFPETVAAVLSEARICWILLEEADALRQLGHSTGRADPALSYRAAGIVLAHDW